VTSGGVLLVAPAAPAIRLATVLAMVPAATVAPAKAPAAMADATVAFSSHACVRFSQAVTVVPVLATVRAATAPAATVLRFITALVATAVLAMEVAMALATEAAAMSFHPTAAMELPATARLATVAA